jgi:hypothetical protein
MKENKIKGRDIPKKRRGIGDKKKQKNKRNRGGGGGEPTKEGKKNK